MFQTTNQITNTLGQRWDSTNKRSLFYFLAQLPQKWDQLSLKKDATLPGSFAESLAVCVWVQSQDTVKPGSR